MATTEKIGLQKYKDDAGNTTIMYPITKAEAVDGLEELLTLDSLGAAAADHNHDSAYAAKSHSHSEYAAKSHSHSDYAAKTHSHTPAEIGAEAAGAAASAVSSHNTNTSAHGDIRNLITGLTNRLNALADSDDTTLDQMSEIVDYIKSNKALIDSITTSKVNVSDIINNLTTNVSNKPLSAAQGVALKALVDAATTAAANAQSTANSKQAKITGTAGQFVVIGSDGNVTTKTVPDAEEASF